VEREIELRLVARLKAGDGAAFEAVYEAFRPRLFSFLVRLSHRRDVAEDLLEETWLRLVARAGDLTDETRLGPWLFTVARNLFASWCRHRSLDENRLSDLVPSWPGARPRESPFEAAARAELERRVETAAVCGISSVTLRARLHRARARLAAGMGTSRAELRAKAG